LVNSTLGENNLIYLESGQLKTDIEAKIVEQQNIGNDINVLGGDSICE
jgi:hypothetical protein